MMIEAIGSPAMLEQLAEEATELAQASLKVARVLRKENPTPVTLSEACVKLLEEYTDVVQCALELMIIPDCDQIAEKALLFKKRMEERKQGEK